MKLQGVRCDCGHEKMDNVTAVIAFVGLAACSPESESIDQITNELGVMQGGAAASLDEEAVKEHFAPLNMELAASDNGFRLKFDVDPPLVSQTLTSPKEELLLHVVQRSMQTGNITLLRKDLIVIQPAAKLVRSYKLMEGVTSDSYTASSVTEIFGFMNEQEVVYVSLDHHEQHEFFNIEKLNVYTGERFVLFEGQPKLSSPDFAGRSWLNGIEGKLLINSHHEGITTVYDVHDRTSVTLEQRFPNSWPEFALYPSPDGSRFWNGRSMYDLEGKQKMNIPEKGRHMLGKSWSPDGQFTAYHETIRAETAHYLDNDLNSRLAPQTVVIMDRNGRLLHTIDSGKADVHLELLGWLPDEKQALLQYYNIDRNLPPNKQRVNLRYELVDLTTGKRHTLQRSSLEQMIDLTPVQTDDKFYFIDSEANAVVYLDERADYLGKLDNGTHLWRKLDAEGTGTAIVQFHPDQGLQMHHYPLSEGMLYQHGWLISLPDWTYRKL